MKIFRDVEVHKKSAAWNPTPRLPPGFTASTQQVPGLACAACMLSWLACETRTVQGTPFAHKLQTVRVILLRSQVVVYNQQNYVLSKRTIDLDVSTFLTFDTVCCGPSS